MHLGKTTRNLRVVAGLLLVVSIVGGWWFWTRATQLKIEVGVKPKAPFVRLAGSGLTTSDQVLQERAEYFDPTPLFFPTEWNFGQRRLQENLRREPEQVFGVFEAKLTFGEQNFKSFGFESDAAPDRLVDVLGQGNERPLGGMGQIDRIASTLDPRSGLLEVSDLADGKLVMTQVLADITFPRSDFKPAEFFAIVSSSGFVGEPVLVSGSEGETFDAFLRTYLVSTFRLGERLSPGRYRLVVGP